MSQKLTRRPVLNVITLRDVLSDALMVTDHEESGHDGNDDAHQQLPPIF
jgi:hypothetical protein